MTLSEAPSPEDLTKFKSLLQEIDAQAGDLLTFVQKLVLHTNPGESLLNKGLSLLDVKNHLMLNYLIDLAFLMLKKLDSASIKGDPAIKRLAETRVVLERTRPIESKLKYQIDKSIKMLSADGSSKDGRLDTDPLKFKANLDDFDDSEKSDNEDVDSIESDEESENKKSKTYVPPKLVAMPYSDEQSKEERALERAKRRAMSSSLVQELREQYTDAPAEIRDDVDIRRRKVLDQSKRRIEYEESNLLRIPLTKKQRQTERRSATDSTLNYLLNFGNYNVDEMTSGKRNKKTNGGKRNDKKGFKMRKGGKK